MDIDVWITTMSGAVLYHKRSREHGKFSFRTSGASRRHDDEMLDDEDEYDYQEESTEEDTYKICLEHQQAPSRAHATGTKRMISFRLNEAYDGVAGKEGDAAEKGDTDRLQATMRDMHSSLSGMIGDLNQLQRREKGLTNRMKKMAKRVTALAVFSLVVTLATSAMQFRYYQGYFKQKKLC